MSEDYGNDFEKDYVTIEDEDGTEIVLEYIDTMDYNGSTFHAYLPTDIDENDPDYGIIILRSVPDENGEELLESIDDDDELTDVYNHFMVLLYDEEDEEEEETEKV